MLGTATVRHQDLLLWQQFLLGTLIDSRLGYRTVMQHVQNQALQEFCLGKSYERADMAQVLAAEISWSGAQPRRRGSPLGQLHRLWLRQFTLHSEQQAVIRECLRGEFMARDNYLDVVSIVGLPDDLSDLLRGNSRWGWKKLLKEAFTVEGVLLQEILQAAKRVFAEAMSLSQG